MISFIVAVILMTLTVPMVPLLFGERFATVVPAALVLVVANAVAGWNSVIEEGLRGLGHPIAMMWAELGGLAIMAVSLLFLLKPLMIMGAALASLLSYTTVSILLLTYGRRLTGYSLATLLCPTSREIYAGWRRIGVLVGEMKTK
jgi:O-antigen/teichoic acid export membrane protein